MQEYQKLYHFHTEEDKRSYLKDIILNYDREMRNHGFVRVYDIPIEIPKNVTLYIDSNNVSYLTHGLHSYPAKFIPQIPRWAIDKFAKETKFEVKNVFDPFCGSGTTLIESKLAGLESYGIDIDPLSRLITKVKTTPIEEKELLIARDFLFNKIRSENYKELSPLNFPNRKYWFKDNIAKQLTIIRKNIELINELEFSEKSKKDIIDFFLICLSAIVRDVSNADPNIEVPEITKHMRNLKEEHWKNLNAIYTFIKYSEKHIKNMMEFSKLCKEKNITNIKAEVIGEDARNLKNIKDESIDLVITSPPYINAVDYTRAHKLEMYWLGLISNTIQERNLKRKHIGSEQIFSSEYNKLKQFDNEHLQELNDLIKQIYKTDKQRAFIVWKFFEDMKKCFQELKRVMKVGSYFVLVIGNNSIRKILIKNSKFLTLIAKEIGFEETLRFEYIIRNRSILSYANRAEYSGKINNDNVVVLRKESE